MCSWGLVFKPRGLAWASDLGGDRCERSFGLRTYQTSLASRLENPRALCLRSSSFPWPAQECGVWAWGAVSAASLPF